MGRIQIGDLESVIEYYQLMVHASCQSLGQGLRVALIADQGILRLTNANEGTLVPYLISCLRNSSLGIAKEFAHRQDRSRFPH
jgi:hypothetical protein